MELTGTKTEVVATLRVQQELSPERPDGSPRPEKQALDILVAFAIAAFAVAWTFPLFNFFQDRDEGVIFQGALRILRGELPYRDFFSAYTPGSYYLYALLFRVFGPSIWAPRVLWLLYGALFSALTYLLARRFCSRSAAATTALLLAVVCPACRGAAVLHSWDSTATTLLAMYCAVWLLETNSYLWAFLAGAFAGLTVVIEQSKGAGLLLGFALAGAAIFLLYRPAWKGWHALAIGSGGALPVLAGLGYFAYRGALSNLVLGVLWPLKHYGTANKLPYGTWILADPMTEILRTGNFAERLLAALASSAVLVLAISPIVVLGFGTAVLYQSVRHSERRQDASRLVIVLSSVLLGVSLSTLVTGRADFIRVIYIAPFFFPLLPALLQRRFFNLPWLAQTLPLVVLYCSVAFAFLGFLYTSQGWHPAARVFTRRGTLTTSQRDEVIPYVVRHVPAGAELLMYPYAPEYSFFTGTFNPIYFDYLQQGMHTKAEFEAARDQFARGRTPYAVYELTFVSHISTLWPSTPANALAVDPFGDYILAHYKPCKVLEGTGRPFLFMALKGTACPVD